MKKAASPAVDAFRRVADATYDWESWISPRGKLRWVNPAVTRMTGYSVTECLRMKDYPLPLVHAEDRERVRQVNAAAARGASGNDVEFRIVQKDESERWVAISWQRFRDDGGKSLGYRTSVRDIHERKLAEERLRRALVLVEQAAAARNQFLANVSHELRTPLQCILGYTQLLERTTRSEDSRGKLALIDEQAQALLEIVGNVLDLAALQSKDAELLLGTADLHEKLRAIVEGARPLAEQKGLELCLEIAPGTPRYIRTDKLRLRQIVTNLLSNAIKFTDSGSVRVRVRPLGKAKQGVRIEVRDTGIGIPAAARERIFEPFAQADGSIARRFGGTGLGLSISQRLAAALGGEIVVTSRVGRGLASRSICRPRASRGQTCGRRAAGRRRLPAPSRAEPRKYCWSTTVRRCAT